MQLDHAFDAFSIVLLEGDPGQGKTTLAAEFADWFSRIGGNDGPVMYTSFDHRVTLASVLDQLARIFHVGLEEAGHDWTRIFNLMYELQTIQRPSASLLIGARAR